MPYLAEAAMTDRQLRRAHELMALRGKPVSGPGAFWLRNPSISECAEPMRQHMEQGTSLPLALSELAILMTARHWSATYAWCRHEPQAIKAGIEASAVEDLRACRIPKFADDRATIVELVVRTLLETGGLDDTAYGRALAAFGFPALVELVSLAGYGSLVSLANSTFEPDPSDGTHDYLPPGVAPHGPMVRHAHASRLEASDDAGARTGLIGVAAVAWGHCPKIAECARGYDETLRMHLTMAPATGALIVLLVARYWLAWSLWPDLGRFASARGLDARTVAAVVKGIRPDGLNPEQAIAHDVAAELLAAGRTSDATFASAREVLGLTVLTEIPAIVGFLTMVALTANVFAPAMGAPEAG